MTTECSVEQCTTTATHRDQFGAPICAECMTMAVEFGEDNLDFTPITPPCKYNHGHFCSCPQCLLTEDNRCTDTTCQHHPTPTPPALTIFEESLTSLGLEKISKKAELMPIIAKTTEDYALVYEFSTALKRGSVAARKKIKELKRDLKKQYDEAKGKIEKDLAYVLNIIDPIIGKLAASRDYMECWTEALKENKARLLAAKQEAERNRIAEEKKRVQDETEARQAEQQKILDEAAAKLKQDKYEFDCERSRLSRIDAEADAERLIEFEGYESTWLLEAKQHERNVRESEYEKYRYDFDVAWQYAHDIERSHEECACCASLNSGPSNCPDHPIGPSPCRFYKADPDINELAEFANPDPAPPVETSTHADRTETIKVSGQEITINESDTAEDIEDKITRQPDSDANITHQTENFSDGPASIIYSDDPVEKEKQLLDQDQPKCESIIDFLKISIGTIENHEWVGFESLTATTATRQLIENLQLASGQFKVAISHPVQTTEPDETVTDSDCSF